MGFERWAFCCIALMALYEHMTFFVCGRRRVAAPGLLSYSDGRNDTSSFKGLNLDG